MRDKLPPEIVAGMMEELHLRFEAGNKNALIQAIRRCGQQQMVMPEWVVDAFFRATNKWYQMDIKSLDKAIGVAWPKGKSIAAAKKRRRLQFAVLNAVSKAKSEGCAVDDQLFEQIGRRLGLGKTLVKEYYKSARALMGAPSAKTVRIR